MKFPSLDRKDLLYDTFPPLPLNDLSLEQNILEAVAKKDYMIYAPYQNFAYVIKFLRRQPLIHGSKRLRLPSTVLPSYRK